MNLKEFDEFRLTDTTRFHDKLNPALFSDEKLKDNIREQLLVIAGDFMDHLGISDIDLVDVTLSGSNAAYSYTPQSDIDLHLIVNLEKIKNDDVYRELFTSKKIVFNDSHDIKIKGYDVELYVQEASMPVRSLGEYSLLKDKWIKFPSKRVSNLSEKTTREKFIKLVQLSELALRSNDLTLVQNLLATLHKYRQIGLDLYGEFGPENLAYKALRNQKIIDKLYKLRDKLHSAELTIENMHKSPANLQEVKSRYKEIEFICTNPQFPDATDPELQKKMYRELKKIPGVIPLFQDQSEYSEGQMSLTAIYKDPNIKQFILKLAKSLGVGVDLIQSVTDGYVDRAIRGEHEGQITDEDWHPNATPPGPEFKPTMPAGTVKVDVSDVYDWYKLGQHVSNLHGLGHHDFGKGPPSTIFSFGDEDTEHKYIKDLEKTGLTTTDIDPVDPKQPKGMKRQKVDPTYNVDETTFLESHTERTNDNEDVYESASGYIPSEKEKNDPRFKTGLTVDVKPDSIKQNAKKLGLGNIHRSGIPPIAKSNGKF